jgi:hypothetical protein
MPVSNMLSSVGLFARFELALCYKLTYAWIKIFYMGEISDASGR